MTEALAMPHDHYAGRWTVDEVLALPEDGMRRELVEGRLVESPVPAKPHQMAGKRLEKLLDDFAPLELEAAREINLRFEADLLIPDVMVAATEVLAGPGHFVEPADVVIVVEILSPGNSKFERAWKPRRYAEAGIPFYVEVDLVDGPRVTFHELRGSDYVKISYASAGGRLHVERPFEVSFDPGDLVGVRRSAGQQDAGVGDARDQHP
ncbi:MAG: Uma2 family endonuclease [Actinoallomurus sp.]